MTREAVVARVPSLTNARLRYDVTLKDGELFCACPAFHSWRKRGEKCWHLRVWEAASRALDRCWNNHGTPDGFVCQACLLALLSKAAGVVKAEYVTVDELKEKVARVRAKKKRAAKRGLPCVWVDGQCVHCRRPYVYRAKRARACVERRLA